MSGYVLSAHAERDLVEIWEFLAAENLDVADRIIGSIREGIERLAGNPGLGHSRQDLTGHPVKFFAISSYLIVFQPGSSPLAVVRILHGRRDVANLL